MLFWKSTNLVRTDRSQASCVLDQDIDVQNVFFSIWKYCIKYLVDLDLHFLTDISLEY